MSGNFREGPGGEEEVDLDELPWDEKLVNSHPNTRKKGYQELEKKFQIAEEEDPFYETYKLTWRTEFKREGKKDPNTGRNQVVFEPAGIAALGAAKAFVECAPLTLVQNIAKAIVSVIVTKCLGKKKYDKAIKETIVELVGAECGELCTRELMTAVDKNSAENAKNKDRKAYVVLTTISAAMDKYGGQAIPMDKMWKKVGLYATHSDKDVRNVVKELIIKINHLTGWKDCNFGDASETPQIKKLEKALKEIFVENKKKKKPVADERTRLNRDRYKYRDDGSVEKGPKPVPLPEDDPVVEDEVHDDGNIVDLWGSLEDEEVSIPKGSDDKEMPIVKFSDIHFGKSKVFVEGRRNPVGGEEMNPVNKYGAYCWKSFKMVLAKTGNGPEEGAAVSMAKSVDSLLESIKPCAIDPEGADNLAGRLVNMMNGIPKGGSVGVIMDFAKIVIVLCKGLKKEVLTKWGKHFGLHLLFHLDPKRKPSFVLITAAMQVLHEKKLVSCSMLVDQGIMKYIKDNKKQDKQLAMMQYVIKHLKQSDLQDNEKYFVNFFPDLIGSSGSMNEAAFIGIAWVKIYSGEGIWKKLEAKTKNLKKEQKEKIAKAYDTIAAELEAKRKKKEEASVSKDDATNLVPAMSPKTGTSLSNSAEPLIGEAAPDDLIQVQLPDGVSDDEGVSSLPVEDAVAALRQRYGGGDSEFDLEGLKEVKKDERVKNLKTLNTALEKQDAIDKNEAEVLVGVLASFDWEDKRTDVVIEKLATMRLLCEKCSKPLPRKSVLPVALGVIDHLVNRSIKAVAAQTLYAFAAATSLRFLFRCLRDKVGEGNVVRNQTIFKFSKIVMGKFGLDAIVEENIVNLVSALTKLEKNEQVLGTALQFAAVAAVRLPSDSMKEKLSAAGVDVGEYDEVVTGLSDKDKVCPEPELKRRFPRCTRSASRSKPETVSKNVAGLSSNNAMPSDASSSGAVRKPRRTGKSLRSDSETSKEKTVVRKDLSEHFDNGSKIVKDLGKPSKTAEDIQNVLRIVNEKLNDADAVELKGCGEFFKLFTEILGTSKNKVVWDESFKIFARVVKLMGPESSLHVLKAMDRVIQGCFNPSRKFQKYAFHCLETCTEEVGLEPAFSLLHKPYEDAAKVKLKMKTEHGELLEWARGKVIELDENEIEPSNIKNLIKACCFCFERNDRTAKGYAAAEKLLIVLVVKLGDNFKFPREFKSKSGVRTIVDGIIAKSKKDGGKSFRSTGTLDAPERIPRLAPDGNDKHEAGTATPASVRRRTPLTSSRNSNRLKTPVSRFSARNQTASNVTEESNISRSQATPRRQGRPVSMRVPSAVGGMVPPSGRRRAQSVAISQPIFEDGELSEEDDMILISNENRSNRLDRYMYLRRTANEKANEERTAPVIYFEDYGVLKEDLESCVSPALLEMLTARSSHFKQYMKAIEIIEPVMSRNPEITVQVSDVLLRWAAYRIEDTRTPSTCLTAVVSFVNNLCEVLISSEQKLSDYEASALIPAICGKLDNNKEDVRQKLQRCILCIQDVVPGDIMLVYLSLSLKRNLGRNASEEVQQQVCTLIDAKCSSGAGLPVGVLSKIAEVSYGDNEVTGLAAAACMSRAHHHFGDELWEILGTLTDDQARKMEERLVAANAGQENDIATPSRFATPTTQGIDIRPSDYRLSVAPEPAPSIRSALDSVLTKKTPAKTRPAFGRSRAVYSSGARPTEESMESGKGDIKAYVLLKLNQSSWEELEEGLSELYKNLQLEEKSVLRNSPSEIVPRLSDCFSNALEQIEEMKGDGDMLILKRLLNAIMAYAREPKVIVQLTQEALESLLNDLLYAMVPEDVGGNSEWKQIRRGVNLVLLKVLESCPKNLLYTSLIHVLGSSIRQLANTRTEAVRLRLNAKCSFCINSIAKTAQNGFGHCDVSALLQVMNEFLIEYPIGPEDAHPSEQQAMAFRLLKTLVDRLVEDMGISIRNHLPTPSGGNDSQLSRYVEMILTSSNPAGASAAPVPASGRRVRFDGSPSSHPGEASGGGSGQVYLRKLKEIQQKYNSDATSRSVADHPDSSVIDSSIVEAEGDTKGRMSPAASGAMKEAKAESISRAAALRERMARIRSGEV